MSVIVSALCWKLRIPGTDKLILMRLADFASDDGTRIYPAVRSVADECGVSERCVQYTIRKLQSAGVLVMLGDGKGGRNRTTEYAIDMEAVREHVEQKTAPLDAIKGEQSAPIQKGAKGAKGANDDVKGANHALKGANHAEKGERGAPEPLGTVNNHQEPFIGGSCDARSPVHETKPDRPAKQNPKSTRLPPDWVIPADWLAWALTEGVPERAAAREAEKFRDFWLGKSGADGRKNDWFATWRNWVRRSVDMGAKNGRRNDTSPASSGNGFLELRRKLGYDLGGPDGVHARWEPENDLEAAFGGFH